MQEDPSRNRYNGIIYEQTNNYVPNPYEKLCEFGEIMWKSKWIYQRTLINKQENRLKKGRVEDAEWEMRNFHHQH